MSIEFVVQVDAADDDDAGTTGWRSRIVSDVLRSALPDATVSAVKRPNQAGMKGDPVTVGTVLVSMFTSGAAVALLNCFKAMFARDHSLGISLSLPGGKKIKVNAKNLQSDEVQKFLAYLDGMAIDPEELQGKGVKQGTAKRSSATPERGQSVKQGKAKGSSSTAPERRQS
jgi:hypothetical protein